LHLVDAPFQSLHALVLVDVVKFELAFLPGSPFLVVLAGFFVLQPGSPCLNEPLQLLLLASDAPSSLKLIRHRLKHHGTIELLILNKERFEKRFSFEAYRRHEGSIDVLLDQIVGFNLGYIMRRVVVVVDFSVQWRSGRG
jgi:hypothetical protein